jgi:hypothetical protein
MKKSQQALVLRIALLMEEYSEKELSHAVKILRAHGWRSEFLDLLAPSRPYELSDGGSKTKPGRQREVKESKVVAELKLTDPSKARLLDVFEQAMRRGEILKTMEELKRFGERVSKNFQARKSRADSISPLIGALAERSLDEIGQAINDVPKFDKGASDGGYQRLANFLIKGKE